MGRLSTFFRFWYDFIVGDDWRVAVGVTLAFVVTAAVTRATGSGWWVLPAAVVAVLVLSLRRAALRSTQKG